MYHFGSLTLSGEMIFNMEIINSLSSFQYHVLFIFDPLSQIYLKPIPTQDDDQPQQFNMEIPIAQHSLQSLLQKDIFNILLIYAKTITIEPKNKYMHLITSILEEWKIDYQWRKKANNVRIVLSGTASVSQIDFETFPSLLTSFNRKILMEIKIYNSYIFTKKYFEEKLLLKLYEGDNIDEEFDSAMLQIKLLYRSLAATERFPYKSKEYSFEKLSKEIKEMLLTGNDESSEETSIHNAIEQALQNMFQEQYQSLAGEGIEENRQFYISLAKKYLSSVTSDEKMFICVKILLQRLFQETNICKKKPKTNYGMKKRLGQIKKQIIFQQNLHKKEKENLFSIIHEKQKQIQELKCQKFSIQTQVEKYQKEIGEKQAKIRGLEKGKKPHYASNKVKTQLTDAYSDKNILKDQTQLKNQNSSLLLSQRSTKDLYKMPKKENMKNKKKIQSTNTTFRRDVKKRQEKKTVLVQKNIKL